MKISENWLREWVSPKLDTQALANRLTMAGLEVGAIEPVAPDLDRVIVAQIVSIAPHPSADKLRICQVNIGEKKSLQIVCGAANAAVGMKAPLALEGAKLPNGVAIKKSEIRGVASAGMLCSAVELGLADSSEGLLVLDSDAKVGTSLSEHLGLNDVSLEVDLTPNRGDCLSVQGVARELAALTGTKLKKVALKKNPVKQRQSLKVKISAAQDCPCYLGRVISNINSSAVTPGWMKEKLRRSGLRSIHPVVDVTNFVMLELGQPMHAFDLQKISGNIHVRHALKNESITLLDGNQIKLEAGSLIIADDKQPLALAGIMGGMESAVSDGTRDLFLESAYFRPEAISTRARSYGLHTDSSHRFERGVDPTLQNMALERATTLLLAIVGGKAGPIVEQVTARFLPRPAAITLRIERIEQLLGIRVLPNSVELILKRLGMKLKKSGKVWHVTAPSYRFDVTREVDLIEEIARVHGYDKIPSQRPRLEMVAAPVPESMTSDARWRALLIDRNYQEVITYSFVDPKIQTLLDPHTQPARLANPISADMAVMRTTLWPGLLQAIVHNLNRQQTRVRCFELGRTFIPQGDDFRQEKMLAGAIVGDAMAEQWGVMRREADFYDAKADVEAILTLAGIYGETHFLPAQHPSLHPGQSAEIRHGGRQIGLIGALHPQIQSHLGLDRPVLLFELQLSALQGRKIPIFQEISKFPSIRRDIALVLPLQTPAQAVLDRVTKVAGKLLVDLELFDEYRGKGIDSGRKSLALGLTLQDSSRTLNEDEIEKLMAELISVLGTELGAIPRQ